MAQPRHVKEWRQQQYYYCSAIHRWKHRVATYHYGGNVENVEERDNRNPKGDKVPLGDNRGATHGNFYLMRCFVGLMYPPFLFSTLESKQATLIWLEGKYRRSLSQKASSHLLNFHTQFPHWIPWLVIWRATLSSLTDSLVLQINSSIISHLLPRNRHQPNQHFMFQLHPSAWFYYLQSQHL